MLALLEERDKGVREEAKALLVEIYRWMGPTLKSQLTNLKQTQVRNRQVSLCVSVKTSLKPNMKLELDIRLGTAAASHSS